MSKTKHTLPTDRLTEKEERQIIAGNLRERVYSTITLLAVMAILWQHTESQSTLGAIGTILGTVIALWAASLVAVRISYRAIHGRPITMRRYVKTFMETSGLLAPAIAPILLISIGGVTGLYDLQAGITAAIVANLLFLFGTSFTASRKIYDTLGRQLMISLLEMSIGLGVVVLKLLVGK